MAFGNHDGKLRSFGKAFADIPKEMDDALHDVYSLKGVRAWHDHFALHLQKLFYLMGALISAIFLVNESDRVGRHPGKIDFEFVTRPVLYAVGVDVFGIIANFFYLMMRSGMEKHLSRFKEPAVWERMLLHVLPVAAAVMLGLLAYSIPYCFLTTKNVDTAFCGSSFTPTVNRILLVLAIVAAVSHMIYGVYHHWRSTSTVHADGAREAMMDDDDYEYTRLLEANDGRGSRRGHSLRR